MTTPPRLTKIELKVLLGIPFLFPDGDSDDLNVSDANREAVSHAIKHLIGLGLASASSHEGENPFASYYRDVELTTAGEELRRDLARWWIVRWWEREWRWFFPTAIALCSAAIALSSLGLSLWNFFHLGSK